MKKIEAVIFDMDGLLLDSEKIALETFVISCSECSFEPDLAVYVDCIGTTGTGTEKVLKKGYGDEFPYDKIKEIWFKLYNEKTLHTPVPVKEGAISLLTRLKEKKFTLAVATSSRSSSAVIKLTNAGLKPFFPLVIGGDMVLQGKPSPEIYVKTASELGISPLNCLVLEDSDNGVRAAHAAGMEVIQIPDIKKPSKDVAALGHRILNSLNDVIDLPFLQDSQG